jgi:dinuclear metal center YbgI/SA1388 family protein
LKIKDVIRDLEVIAPPVLADDGDKIGLQVGDPEAEVTRIVCAVDPTRAVVDYAVDSGAELLLLHHPLIYSPVPSIVAGDPLSDILMRLVRGGTAAYAAHTNLDAAPGGINDVLAERLGVRDTQILTVRRPERLFKIIVFVPEESVVAVRDAMAEADAGHIGNYSHCSFMSPGTGTFLPLEGSDPYIGKQGNLEEAAEVRLEMIVPEWKLDRVLSAMVERHPYEEVAYDIIALANKPIGHGYGRVGVLESVMTLGEFRKVVEDSLGYRETRMIGDPERPIRTVALCGGAGKSLIRDAKAAGADVYVTGDVGHHDMLAADAMGLAVIDASHYHTERPGTEALAAKLAQMYSREPISVEFRI